VVAEARAAKEAATGA